jgi:anti-anti-sigma factor
MGPWVHRGMMRGERAETWRFSAAMKVAAGEIALALSGRLGHAAVPTLEQTLRRLPPSLGQGRVVLDLAGVDYLSSAGLRVIESLCSRLEKGGRRLSVRHVNDPVSLVLDLSGLSQRLERLPDDRPTPGA